MPLPPMPLKKTGESIMPAALLEGAVVGQHDASRAGKLPARGIQMPEVYEVYALTRASGLHNFHKWLGDRNAPSASASVEHKSGAVGQRNFRNRQ